MLKKVILMACFIGVLTPVTVTGATYDYDSGPRTEASSFNRDTINLYSGADVEFTGELKNKTEVNAFGGYGLFSGDIRVGVLWNISGGDVEITGRIQNQPVVNLSSGSIRMQSIGNKASLNVSGGDLSLTGPVSNNATLDLSGGNVFLESNNVFTGTNDISTSGGSIFTQEHSFETDALSLTGNTLLDLGGAPDISVDLGEIHGTGKLTVTNFTHRNTLAFDAASSTVNVSDQIYFGTSPATTDPNDSNIIMIPEPQSILLFLAILTFLCYRDTLRFA